MIATITKSAASLTMFGVLALFASGCSQQATDADADAPTGEVTEASHDDHDHDDDHSGWWCTEHGIPEEQCSLCSADAAEACQANGDWCEEHDRAESQCFLCDPSRADKFAKLYVAKFGEEPPKPTE